MIREQIESPDLPDDCQHDHVVIYKNHADEEPPFCAIPFDYVGDDDLSNGYYEEPEEWAVTEQYREAVAEQTDTPLKHIRLRQPPTTDPEEVDPL